MNESARSSTRFLATSLLGIAATMCIVLHLMGRVWWCEAGDLAPWSWDVWSQHNSQHLLDPYALSHVEHGVGLFLLLTPLANRWPNQQVSEHLSVTTRTMIIAGFEATWEIAENTPMMINLSLIHI